MSSFQFKCAVHILLFDIAFWCYGSISFDGAQQHFEKLHGIFPVLLSFERHHFVNRSALFHQQLRRHRDIVTAKQNIESTYSFSPKSSLMDPLRSSAPLSQLVFNSEGVCYGSSTCNVTGMVASL